MQICLFSFDHPTIMRLIMHFHVLVHQFLHIYILAVMLIRDLISSCVAMSLLFSSNIKWLGFHSRTSQTLPVRRIQLIQSIQELDLSIVTLGNISILNQQNEKIDRIAFSRAQLGMFKLNCCLGALVFTIQYTFKLQL